MAEGKRGSKRRIKAAERRILALELRKKGKSYRDIATELGCNSTTAYKDVQAGLTGLAQKQDSAAAGLRILEQERINIAMNAIHDKVVGGDLEAINVWCRLIEAESKLFSLMSGADVQVNNNTIVMDFGESSPMAELPDIIDIEPEAYSRLPAPEAAPDVEPATPADEKPKNPIQAEVVRLNQLYGAH